MAIKGKLNGLRRQVAKLTTSTARRGQGAGWLATWKLDDLCQMVLEAANPPGRYAAALLMVGELEARRLGRSADPQVRAALDALTRAVERWLNPPAGTDREKLNEAVGEALRPVSEWVLDAWGVNRDAADAWTAPPGGRPPRAEELPDGWFTADAMPTGENSNDDPE